MKFLAIALASYLSTTYAILYCDPTDFVNYVPQLIFSNSSCSITASSGSTMVEMFAAIPDATLMRNFEISFGLMLDDSVIPQFYTFASTPFRRASANSQFEFSFQNYDTLLVEFGRKTPLGYTTLTNTQTGIVIDTAEVYDIRVVVNGNEGWLYVDGTQYLYTNELTDYQFGQIGIRGRYDTEWSDFDITPITVSPTVDPTTQPTTDPTEDPRCVDSALFCEASDWSGSGSFTFSDVSNCTMSTSSGLIFAGNPAFDCFDDFEISFGIMFKDSSVPQFYTLAATPFRRTSANEQFSFSFQNYDTLLVEFGRASSGGYTTLENTQTGIVIDYTKVYQIRVIVFGNEGWLYVDGVQYLYTNALTDYQQGQVAMQGFYSTEWTDIYIKPITSLPTSAPTIDPTIDPTPKPTAEPTFVPSMEPTVEPTIVTGTTADVLATDTTFDEGAANSNQQWLFAIICSVLFGTFVFS